LAATLAFAIETVRTIDDTESIDGKTRMSGASEVWERTVPTQKNLSYILKYADGQQRWKRSHNPAKIHRHRNRYRDRHRDRHTQTDTDAHTETHRHRRTYRHRHTDT
jgi:hypothetical protein